ncbi:MAG: 1-acyl-sn-glycerol-3-phosphate acyltransferase [Deltaproteobacteria bacterium]|nr:1-acyl-sn-glycerol-3-phosphate acyltransferase [Deltaproteobacteria bacterium]
MKQIAAYILTPIFWGIFWLLLLLFHPIQVITNYLWGYRVRNRCVDFLNFLLLKNLWLIGSRVRFQGFEKLPSDRPLIIVANHQSTLDISPVVWGFRRHHPKFIAKIELARGIPSISYNLKHGGSALIDRSKRAQSIKEIIKLGRYIEKEKYAACIFPEGTRSRDGRVKTFQSAGIAALLRAAPSALVVPFVIDGNYQLVARGHFPLALGIPLTYSVLDPIEPAGKDAEEVTELAEAAIKAALKQ